MNRTPRWKYAAVYAGVATVVAEAVTVAMRFGTGMSAADFNATKPPLLLQIHHLFWCLPLLPVVPFVWHKPKLSGALLGISIAADGRQHRLALAVNDIEDARERA